MEVVVCLCRAFSEGIFWLAHCGVAPAQLAYCRVAPDVMRALFGGLVLAVLSALQCNGTEGSFSCRRTAGSLPVMEGAMLMEDVNILAESTATMKATLFSDAGYNAGVLAASSLGVCNAGVLRGRSRCDSGLAPQGAALCGGSPQPL